MRDDIVRRLMLEHRGHQTVYEDDRRRKALLQEAADEIGRLKAINADLLEACNHVIKWLGEPSLEGSGYELPAFTKALKKCRAATAKAIRKPEKNGEPE